MLKLVLQNFVTGEVLECLECPCPKTAWLVAFGQLRRTYTAAFRGMHHLRNLNPAELQTHAARPNGWLATLGTYGIREIQDFSEVQW